MQLRLQEFVSKYLALSGGFEKSVALSSFDFPAKEFQALLNSLDEDYHISRFFHFSNSAGTTFEINGFPQSHVAISAEIQSIL